LPEGSKGPDGNQGISGNQGDKGNKGLQGLNGQGKIEKYNFDYPVLIKLFINILF
jgi:hypothetical protein